MHKKSFQQKGLAQNHWLVTVVTNEVAADDSRSDTHLHGLDCSVSDTNVST